MIESTEYSHFIYLMFIVFLLAQLLTKQYHQCSTRLFPSQCLYYKPDINIFLRGENCKIISYHTTVNLSLHLQEITRANKGWALDSMVLCNEVTKWMKDDIAQPPAEGVYVYGLYLEGAGWDRRGCKLIDSKPKVLFEMMPVIRMYAVNNGEICF